MRKLTGFLNIMKDIKFRPYKVRRHQMVNTANIARRLKFAQIMSQKPLDYCKDLLSTDEKTFVTKGNI